MALHWQWEEKCGTVCMADGKRFPWYEGNGLMIVLNEWDENGETYWSMNWFFADKEHAKNCLGLTKGYKNIFADNPITEVTIKPKYCRNWKALADMLLKAFPDITLAIGN